MLQTVVETTNYCNLTHFSLKNCLNILTQKKIEMCEWSMEVSDQKLEVLWLFEWEKRNVNPPQSRQAFTSY